MQTLSKKQIQNILGWIGKSYPSDIKPPIGIEIEVLTKDFEVKKTKCVLLQDKIKIEGVELQSVIAWRHTTGK